MIDVLPIIRMSADNQSSSPVNTAVYLLAVVMNEEDPDATEETHKALFAHEFQRALDAGFFTDLRYDAMTFEVCERIVVGTAEAGGKG